MPGNSKFDPFQSFKIALKLEKSTVRYNKLISSEGGQDTSACKMSGHYLHAFFGKYLETSADGRTDGQPENIMPQAPKGGGIKSK